MMLAVLGYLPVEEVMKNNKDNTTAPPENIEYIIVLDTLNSNDPILIDDYIGRKASLDEFNNTASLQKEYIRVPDLKDSLILKDQSTLYVIRPTVQFD